MLEALHGAAVHVHETAGELPCRFTGDGVTILLVVEHDEVLPGNRLRNAPHAFILRGVAARRGGRLLRTRYARGAEQYGNDHRQSSPSVAHSFGPGTSPAGRQ